MAAKAVAAVVAFPVSSIDICVFDFLYTQPWRNQGKATGRGAGTEYKLGISWSKGWADELFLLKFMQYITVLIVLNKLLLSVSKDLVRLTGRKYASLVRSFSGVPYCLDI